MNDWAQNIPTSASHTEAIQAEKFQTLRVMWLQRKYDTKCLDHTYRAIADIVYALYKRPQSVVPSVNVVCAIQDIQVANELSKKSVYYDMFAHIYEQALQELETLQKSEF